MEILTAEGLSFTYPGSSTPALQALELHVDAGEFLVLAGASGSGKSTLLRQFKPAMTPHGLRQGRILFRGAPLEALDARAAAEQIGFVQQDPADQLVTDKVWHELAFGLESLGLPSPVIRRRVAETAAYFGISSWFDQRVDTLSGGQMQLLNLAAVMCMQPALLLLDEPTAQLDPIAAEQFLATLARLNRELGTTILLAEQRLESALPLCTRVCVLDGGQLLCQGTPQEAGLALRAQQHRMFQAMPVPMRVWSAVPNDAPCPVTVGEGRAWLAALPTPPEPIPPDPVPAHGAPLLSLREVWFRYHPEDPDILRGLSLTLHAGELLCLLGANGAGKSTALRILAGQLQPQHGVRAGRCRTALLPQDPTALFLRDSAAAELEDAAGDLPAAARAARVREMAQQLALTPLLARHPLELSGGERQRLALGKLLLTQPQALLLDEPTKGLDAAARRQLSRILQRLAAAGTAILLVSHDVEFCAGCGGRCALLFRGELAAEDDCRAFFAGNGYYTTAANRMARPLLPDAVTAEDIIRACGGAVPEEPPPPPSAPPADAPPAAEPDAAPSVDRRTLLTLGGGLLAVGVTLALGLRGTNYLLLSMLILAEMALPMLIRFERRRPRARELALLAVLSALGIAGRAVFAMLPFFKPVLALVILTGASLGCEAGFLVGAVTMLVSNFFFAQGPWTPWQMAAAGLVGALAGLAFARGALRAKRLPLCLFGAVAALCPYGVMMNLATVVMYRQAVTWPLLRAALVSGLPVDLVHAAATVVFLWLFSRPMLRVLTRIRKKYGLIEAMDEVTLK